MSFQHEWRLLEVVPVTVWTQVKADFRRVLAWWKLTARPRLAGDRGLGQPHVSGYSIVFNGVAGFSGETFELGRCDLLWNCCKTRFQPYSLAAKLALIIVYEHVGAAGIQIDGVLLDSHWAEAFKAYETVFGAPSTLALVSNLQEALA